jgi:hypothetical protein
LTGTSKTESQPDCPRTAKRMRLMGVSPRTGEPP